MRAHAVLLIAVLIAEGCAGRSWDPVDVRALPGVADHPDDSVLVLLDEVRIRYFEDPATGAAAFDVTAHERFLILRETEDLDAVDFFHDRTFHVLQDVRARVIRPDGSVRELSRKDAVDTAEFSGTLFSDQRRLVLPLGSPPVGSVVEWEYTLRASGRLLPGAQHFQRGWPVKEARLVVEAPSSWEIEITQRGDGVPRPVVARDGGTVRHTWAMHDVPPLHGEPLQGRWLGPQVLVRLMRWAEGGVAQQNFRDPRELSAFIRRLYGTPPPLEREMKALVEKVVRETPDPRERARRLYDWVRDEVKYCAIEVGWGGWKPIGATDVFRSRYGDCKGKANLLHVLLAEAGIPSRHVLVFAHGGDDGVEPRPFRLELGMNNFNHQILVVDLADGGVVCDPTSTSPFGALPLSDQEADLLPISDPGSDLVKAPGTLAQENAVTATLDLALDARGSVKGTYLAVVQGSTAPGVEYALRGIGRTKLPDMVQDQLFPLAVSPATLRDVQLAGGGGGPLQVSGKVNVLGFGTRGPGVMLLRIADSRPRWLPVFPDRPRRTPIALGPRRAVREVLQLRLPPEARVSALPEPAHVTGPGLEYRLTWSREGDRVVAERTMHVSELAIPAGIYSDLRDAASRIHVAAAQAVVLELPR